MYNVCKKGTDMKTYTSDQVEVKIKELWDNEFYYDWDGKKHPVVEPPTIEVEIKNSVVFITIKKMYEKPGLQFSQLQAISEFFDTYDIGTVDEFSYGGCETCDYGSSYGFTLKVGK